MKFEKFVVIIISCLRAFVVSVLKGNSYAFKLSLIGLFNRIQAQKFPLSHSLLHVYIALVGGHGSYNGELRFVNMSDKQITAKLAGPLAFKDPLQVVEMNFEIKNLVFRNEGKYTVEFCCNGKPIGRRDFFVIGPRLPISESGG